MNDKHAFPIAVLDDAMFNTGLTRRELFAAMAMQGLLTACAADFSRGPCQSAVTDRAIYQADALIAALDAKP